PPPASPPVGGLLDALAAYETMPLITEVDASPLFGRQLTIDLLSMETRYVAHSPTVRSCPDEQRADRPRRKRHAPEWPYPYTPHARSKPPACWRATRPATAARDRTSSLAKMWERWRSTVLTLR